MSFKDDISEAKSKELNYFHKANEDFADDIIESNTECWNCNTDIPMGKKYCQMHCGHPADEFDSFTGQCKGCGKSLNVNMMMTMPSSEAKATEAKIERSNGSMTIDGKQVIKIWESMQGWYWYAVEDQGEYTGVGADGNDVQAHAWFGYVQADFNEWGTFDSKELERAGVWTVPKSNWGWTGKMEESYASEDEINTTCRMCRSPQTVPTGSTNEDYLTEPFECMSCGHMFKLTDPYIVGKNRRSGESYASEFTPLELYETIEPLWNNLSENDRKKIIINTTNGFVGQDNNVKSNWDQIDHMTQQRIADNWDNAFNMIDEDKKTIYGLESKASEAKSKASEGQLNSLQKTYLRDWVNQNNKRFNAKDLLPPASNFYAFYKELQQINYFSTLDQEIEEFINNVISGSESLASEAVCSKCNGSGDYCVECPRCSGTGVSNESKASEDLTFAGRGELNTVQDVWNAMSNDSRYSLMYQLGHDSYGSSTVSFVNGQELTVTDMQKVIDRDEFPDHLLGNIDVEHMKRVAGLESKANESEDVFMYDGTGDSDGVGYWWDFVLPVDEMKHEQLSSILGIDINTAWGFMTPAEQDRIRNYKLNKSMTNEAQLMKEINDGWEFSVIDHGYGGGNKIDGVGNSPDVGLLEVGIFAPDTGDINGQKSAVQGYMTQADVDGLLSTFRTDPAVAFRSIGGEWTFAGQKGLEYQSHYSDMSDITWRDIETMEGSMTLLERNMWLENRFDEITPEDFRRLADTARDD